MDNYHIVRIFVKNDKETHSVEFKDTYLEAQQRFFNVVASDLANDDITWQMAYIVDSKGLMLECRVFDRRPIDPEPEPEPEEE